MYCPFCGVKNDDDKAECFVCSKKLPAMDTSSLGAAPRSRSRSGPQRSVAASSTSGPVTARLGDRLIAVILDSIFVAAVLLVIAAAVMSHWPRFVERTSRTMLTIVGDGVALLVAFIYYWLQEGAFGDLMGHANIVL